MPWSKAEIIAYGGRGTPDAPFTKVAPVPMLIKGKTSKKPTSKIWGMPVRMLSQERLKELPKVWYVQGPGRKIKTVRNPWYEAAERLRNKRK